MQVLIATVNSLLVLLKHKISIHKCKRETIIHPEETKYLFEVLLFFFLFSHFLSRFIIAVFDATQILEWQAHQTFRIIPNIDDADFGNVYKDLTFPNHVYEHINEYYTHPAHSTQPAR